MTKREEARSDPQLALKHLGEVRTAAAAEDVRAKTEASRIEGQVRHLLDVESRFVRRRDHFLAAVEADPSQSRQAAELAATAERLRKDVERLRSSLETSMEPAAAQASRASSTLTRIDDAMFRLRKAMEALELLKVEEANRERMKALEQASLNRLSGLGGAAGARSRPVEHERVATSQLDIDFRVREVTRLAHEAEALAELQRERLS